MSAARSSFASNYRIALLLPRSALRLTRWFRPRLFKADRSLKWPLMSLQARFELGPCRHVVSQMVVAGTVMMLPPFPPPVHRRESGSASPAADAGGNDPSTVENRE